MTVMIQGDQVTAIGLGIRVEKTGASVAAADDIFDVTGEVLVTLMYGVVTTVVAGGTAPELLVNIKDGSNTALAVSTVITSDAVDTVYVVTGDFGVALNGADAPIVGAGGAASAPFNPFILDDITVETTPGGGAAATSGAVKWVMYYLPLSDGASVAAAA